MTTGIDGNNPVIKGSLKEAPMVLGGTWEITKITMDASVEALRAQLLSQSPSNDQLRVAASQERFKPAQEWFEDPDPFSAADE